MNTIAIEPITTAAKDRAIATLTEAFRSDPVAGWLFPGEGCHDRFFPAFAEAFSGPSFDLGWAFACDDHAGAAVWLPPGEESDQGGVERVLERTVPANRQDDFMELFKQMDRFHPHEPHWYLPLIGVSPEHQGRGLGATLLEHMLERCDRDGLPAYLESSNATNLSLYLRHGFEQTGEIQAAASPRLYPMIRRPR